MDDLRRLSAGQDAMWHLHRLAPDRAAYNITLAVRVRTPLEPDLLHRAVAALAARHDLLRSVFTEIDGVPWRVVRAPAMVRLEVREMAGADDDAVAAAARDVGRTPFRLAEGAVRLVLLRRRHDDAVLVVVAHHIISDRTSQWLLMRDLLDAYRGLLTAGEPAWSELDRAFDDHVEDERRLLASPRGPELAERWRRICADAPAAELPADRPRPERQGFTGATVQRRFPDALHGRLRPAADALGVTPFALVLGAFETVLHRYTGHDRFLIGCPASIRFRRGMRDVVGYLVNTLVLRARLSPATTLGEAAVSAYRQTATAMAAARYPTVLLPRPEDRARLFHIAVTMVTANRMEPLLDLLDGGLDYGGLRLELVDVPHMEGQLDLSVELRESRGALTVTFRYDVDLFDAVTIERLADHLVTVTEAAVADPGTPVSGVSLGDETDLERLLAMGTGPTR
ncbi:condensation domain-containing protein [Actinoallomurus spadix]|uniref:Condensation domain-containing protein n=1 Tax=Actinoallomurus spadix TaxID=79912 RepID=A0ABN0XUW9_9ACTN|nr:condensation domain-containing protein [Actinoallomurus spadix]MCO5991436.1 condensation domain-containing protein [Actinoallomurus spadix]